jgi:hypothetical protein
VDLNLTSGNVLSNQSLLLDASSSTGNNTALIGSMPSSIMESPLNIAFESPISSISSTSQSQQPQLPPPRKESHLRSWFSSSSSNSTVSALNSAMVASQPALGGGISLNSPPDNTSFGTTNTPEAIQTYSDSAQSTKYSNKISYGELFISKFNKTGKNPSLSTNTVDQHRPDSPPNKDINKIEQQQQQQQKSSRRTTSLLNLFMSNSQGKKQN